MDIKKLNEQLQRLNKELQEHQITKKVVEDYYPQIEDDDRLDGYATLKQIKRFLKDSPAKDTMIGQEFLNMRRPMESLKLGVENLEDEYLLYHFTYICKLIILNAAGLLKADLGVVHACLDMVVGQIIKSVDMEHINMSDEATQYAINALNIPQRLKELCLELDTKFSRAVIQLVDKTELCKNALNLANELNATL